MISLNRPGKIKGNSDDFTMFNDCNISYFATAGDALNFIYIKLFNERGALKVGVSPLACFHAHYPIALNGHTPVFLDVNRKTFNLDTNKMDEWPEVDVLEVIHIGGNPCDMTKIMDWARRKNVIVIEDCAQALGSKWDGQYLGTFGDFSVYSLIKNIYVSGAIVLSKCLVDATACKKVSEAAMLYKKLRWGMELRCGRSKWNIYNIMLPLLMRLREKNGGFTSSTRTIFENQINLIKATLPSVFELNKKRESNFALVKENVNNDSYSFQETLLNGETNRNRILCVSRIRKAEELIAILRNKGIAANNLTQNYLHGYQRFIKENNLLTKHYVLGSCPIYEDIFPYLFAIPNSPFLSEEELTYIINSLNAI